MPQDAFGEEVESIDDEVWSVAGTEEVVSEVGAEAEVAALGRRVRQGRGWKLFMMLPMLLHRPPRWIGVS